MTASDYTAGLARKRMGAGVLLTHADGRVLLVEPTYKDHWEVPGGAVEIDESPYAAAVREIAEELSIDVVAGRLLVVDWVPALDGRTEGLMLIFDGGMVREEVAARIRVPAEELRGWAWCTPAQAEERLLPLLARRISAALQAREDGVTAYLEDGRPR